MTNVYALHVKFFASFQYSVQLNTIFLFVHHLITAICMLRLKRYWTKQATWCHQLRSNSDNQIWIYGNHSWLAQPEGAVSRTDYSPCAKFLLHSFSSFGGDAYQTDRQQT